MYNIKDFGAVGDGNANDTKAIQNTINAASESGGGTVYIPNGMYVSGTVFLKSNIKLFFDMGAMLKASNNFDDFKSVVAKTPSRYRDIEGKLRSSLGYGLICAYKQKNIEIYGGKIIADEENYWIKIGTEETFEPAISAMPWHFYKAKKNRISMLLLEDCENIRISSFTIEKSPAYAAWMLGCKNMFFDNVFIKNNPKGPNADGLHFSSCENVSISNSHFTCGDDCVAIDGNHYAWSRDFAITNCTFHTSVHAFRIYTGIDRFVKENELRRGVCNIAISNCAVSEACGIFNINADNGDIKNITINGVTADYEAEGTTFIVSARNGSVDNVLMNNMVVEGNGVGVICAEGNSSIDEIYINNSVFNITPKTKKLADIVPGYIDWCHMRPNNLRIINAGKVELNNITVNWQKPVYSDSWSKERRNRLIEAVGEENIKAMEPGRFKLIDTQNSDNVILNNICADEFVY